jgi:glycine dehydrogenase subunit 1
VQALTRIPGVRARFTGPRFHEAVITLERPAKGVLGELAERGILGGLDLAPHYSELADAMLVCATETKTAADIDAYMQALADILKPARRMKRSAT